jgi:outer membrane lipopolysaccharide assembly protein LptE/RlpB
MMKPRCISLVALVAVVLLSEGCGYSLAGRGSFLPAYIRTIGVPLFANTTQVFEIERRVTERVRNELLGRGKYTVLPQETGVDAVLSGTISSISLMPAAFTPQQQASRYVLIMSASIEFKDVKSGKVLWSNPSLQFREEYEVTTEASATDVNAFLGQDVNAQDRLAAEFARTVVSAILEAF